MLKVEVSGPARLFAQVASNAGLAVLHNITMQLSETKGMRRMRDGVHERFVCSDDKFHVHVFLLLRWDTRYVETHVLRWASVHLHDVGVPRMRIAREGCGYVREMPFDSLILLSTGKRPDHCTVNFFRLNGFFF